MKTWLKILGAVGVLIIGMALIFVSYGWFLERQQKVLTGSASPDFPYRDYTLAELNKMYPQIVNADVPTTQSPEETHAKFLAALKKGDFDEAVSCCFRLADRENMKKALQQVSDDGQLNNMISDLSIIRPNTAGDSKASYRYSGTLNGKKMYNTIDFVKDQHGVWYIKSL